MMKRRAKIVATIGPASHDERIIHELIKAGMNVARIAALRAGIPYKVTAHTINRFCSSGLQSIALAAERIMAGFADCVVAGGVESMTTVPMGGNKFSANPTLIADWPETFSAMGITAELVAEQYGIDRKSQDLFATGSHARAAAAIASKFGVLSTG